MVEETFEPGMTVSLVVRRHGVAPDQFFIWPRLVAQGALTAAGPGRRLRGGAILFARKQRRFRVFRSASD